MRPGSSSCNLACKYFSIDRADALRKGSCTKLSIIKKKGGGPQSTMWMNVSSLVMKGSQQHMQTQSRKAKEKRRILSDLPHFHGCTEGYVNGIVRFLNVHRQGRPFSLFDFTDSVLCLEATKDTPPRQQLVKDIAKRKYVHLKKHIAHWMSSQRLLPDIVIRASPAVYGRT